MLEDLRHSLTVSDKIRLSAVIHGVDIDTALDVACAESRFDPTVKNPISTASGVYQWLDGSWAYYGTKYWGTLNGRDKLNADDSIELAMLVLRDRGTTDWNASKWEGYGGGWANSPTKKGYCLA